MKIITHSPQETIAAAKKLGSLLKAGDMIAYKGGLGAGKTTFTRGLAIGLGLGDNVTSPTFALVNEYRGEKISLYHFDMYTIYITISALSENEREINIEDGGRFADAWN